MAACYLGQQVAEGFDKQLDEAAKQLEDNIQNANNAEKFKQLAQDLQILSGKLHNELKTTADEVQQYIDLCERTQANQDNSVAQLRQSITKYQLLLEQLENVNTKIEKRRAEMHNDFQQQLVGSDGIISQGSGVIARLQAKTEFINQYLEKAIVVSPLPAGQDQNTFFFLMFTAQF